MEIDRMTDVLIGKKNPDLPSIEYDSRTRRIFRIFSLDLDIFPRITHCYPRE